MEIKDLIKDVREGSMKNVYLFRGTEEYLVDFYINKIVRKYVSEDFKDLNYLEVGEGRDNVYEDVLNGCETLPFLGEKKVVLLKDLDEIIKSDSSSITNLGDYVLDLPNYAILIIKDEKESLRRNTKLYKNIKKLNGVVEFKKLNYRELGNWVQKRIEDKNKDISSRDKDYFIRLSTYTEYRSEKGLYELENELNKIINHSSKKIITKQDIDAVLIEELDTNIFNLLEAITDKNPERSLKIFNDMISENEPIPRVLFMIMRHFRLILKCKIYRTNGYNDSKTRNKLGISPYEYNKISRTSNTYKENELIKYLNYILDLDVDQKTKGINEHLALEMLIVRLTEKKKI